MICPHCQTANAADANFCINCRQRLTVVCPRCSRRVVSQARYCDACGLALPEYARPGPEAEGEQPAVARTAERPLPAPVRQDEGQATRAPAAAPSSGGGEQAPVTTAALAEAAASPLTQFIPPELMRKLQEAHASGDLAGERRVVTMLFCDVKDSTAAAEKLDPEEWSEIINGAFEHMIRPIYHYEGTVARLMGDGILAFFGAPLAHEDDPQRAVMAGLDIVSGIKPYCERVTEAWGIQVQVRVGINTGLVVVGSVGSDLRMEYTALGDAINLAARMEHTAAPNTVQIAHDTYRLVKPMFDFEELGGIAVRGKSEPVLAYRVLARKAAAGRVRGIEGLHAELVGRDVELQTLHRAVANLKQGVGRIVCVLGEAGLGKSRLVAETRAYFEQLPGPESNWYETSSLSYESHQAYALLQRVIRRMSGIGYDDAPRVIQKKLATLLEDVPGAEQARAGQLLEALFGLNGANDGPPLEGETFKRELLEAMMALWRARFAARPTVLVFDDMHWSDGASVDLLRQLLPLTTEIGLVMICAFRAERRAPAWQLKSFADEEYRHRYTEVMLHPLSEADSSELVSRLLAVPDISATLRANILEKADGNPFFIEEVVRALIENNVVVPEERLVDGKPVRYWVSTGDGADFSIPDNLQSLLAARMDRLEEAARSTLQLASVIGRHFYLRVLQAVDTASPELDRIVGTLLRLDMIRESARVPEVEYSFRNPLTQEAVYRTILLRRRREFHRRVGEAMEELYADRLESFYGLLAHHFTLAGERAKAIQYCRLAARQAVAVYAYEEADQNLRAALDLVRPQEHGAEHLGILEELADVCRLVRDFTTAIGTYQQALDAWDALPEQDNLVAVRLHRKIVEIATDTKWSVDAETYEAVSAVSQASRARLEESLRALEGQPPHAETIKLLVALAADAWRVQSPPAWAAAQRYAQAAVAMAERLDEPVLLSRALGALANVLDGRSELRQHLAVAERRLAICKETRFDEQREEIDALRGMGLALMYVGRYGEALPYLAEAVTRADRIQALDQVTNALGIQAQCHFRADRWDDVLAVEEKWRDLERRYPRERVGETCFFVALSASVHALRGDTERAGAYARESFDYMVSMSGSPDQWQRNQFY